CGFEAHPDPGDAKFDKFAHGVLANSIRGGKHGEFPALPCRLHTLEEAHSAGAVKQEILVHDKEGLHVKLGFNSRHYLEQLSAGLEEIDELAFPAKECRCGAEVAAHRTANRRNDGCGSGTFALGQAYSHDASAQSGNDCRMNYGGVFVFAKVA